MAKDYVDSHSLPAPLITINSWNEWTETSYLQPDTLHGYGYLEAIRRVFGSEGDGVSRLVREKCDGVVSIPMYGEINSLNISAAAAVIMFEASRQRYQ